MSESGFKNISAAAFAKLDFETVTLIDLREPDELLISGIPGAVNIPFSSFPKGIDAIPMGKPVYVFCREGSFNEEVAGILFERGYHEGKRDIFPGRTDRRRKGARCQACCLSDEHGRYGHKKEKLIDGVELGGVATFIGSGETSDISLFI